MGEYIKSAWKRVHSDTTYTDRTNQESKTGERKQKTISLSLLSTQAIYKVYCRRIIYIDSNLIQKIHKKEDLIA